ncbi:hypothetical protein [uncultured Roseovarius sp.]|uniref:hypothetical protein n=1 Tax=uncultured Roseovarius sp. TaxID=293344 RepID=UPI002618EF9F|nr:hypothetical protein [uncultured Roseovarius sp.]
MRKSLIIGVLALVGCAETGPQLVARLGSDPVVSGGTYDSGGGLSVAVDIREYQGRTMVCGVWAQSRQQSILTKYSAPKVIRSGAVYLGRDVLVRGLGFMPEVEPAEDYAGQEAGCTVTGRPWQATDASQTPVLQLPRQVVHVEDDESGTFVVVFKQTGPEA